MVLFKMEIERGRQARELVVHAEDEERARDRVQAKFTGWEITQCIEITAPAHFTIAELEPD